jgi:hypothetical protein
LRVDPLSRWLCSMGGKTCSMTAWMRKQIDVLRYVRGACSTARDTRRL